MTFVLYFFICNLFKIVLQALQLLSNHIGLPLKPVKYPLADHKYFRVFLKSSWNTSKICTFKIYNIDNGSYNY